MEGWTGELKAQLRDADIRYRNVTQDGLHIYADFASESDRDAAFGGIRGRFPSLALDSRGQLHAAWLDITEDNHSQAHVRYGTRQNTEWKIETIDTLNQVTLAFSGARKSVSLDVDRAGLPRIAYADKRVVKYATRTETGWDVDPILEHPEDTYRGMLVLRLDAQDQPAIVFWQRQEGQVGLIRLAVPQRQIRISHIDVVKQ